MSHRPRDTDLLRGALVVMAVFALVASHPYLTSGQESAEDESYGSGPDAVIGLPMPEDPAAGGEPVLGEGAGESRSDPAFVSADAVSGKREDRVFPDIVADWSAAHSCSAEEFTVSFGDADRIAGKLILLDGGEGFIGKLLVGDLPIGIDISLDAAGAHELDLKPGGNVIDLDIVRHAGAQEGSLTVPFAYIRGEGPVATCQINVVNNRP